MLGFLVYDLVLFVPWAQPLVKAEGGFLISPVIYQWVLTWSGLLALYFLLMHRPTRFFGAVHSSR